MVPEAPPRLSISTGCLSPSAIFWPMMRVATSVGPPAGKGTMMVIGLAGKAWAKAVPAMSGSARASRARRAGLRTEEARRKDIGIGSMASEDAVGFQLGELLVGQPQQRLQHLVRAFAELRRRVAHRQPFAVEAIGRRQHVDAAGHRMRLRGHQAAIGRALRIERLEQAEHLAAGNARAGQLVEQGAALALAELAVDLGHQRLAVR